MSYGEYNLPLSQIISNIDLLSPDSMGLQCLRWTWTLNQRNGDGVSSSDNRLILLRRYPDLQCWVELGHSNSELITIRIYTLARCDWGTNSETWVYSETQKLQSNSMRSDSFPLNPHYYSQTATISGWLKGLQFLSKNTFNRPLYWQYHAENLFTDNWDSNLLGCS